MRPLTSPMSGLKPRTQIAIWAILLLAPYWLPLIGVASGVTAVFLPAASEAIMYVMMAVVLLIRPRGLLGEEGMMT